MPKKIIHIHQHRIRANIHKPVSEREKPVTVRTYKSVQHCNEALFKDKDGKVLGKIRYDNENPLSCGARVWLEFYDGIKIEFLDDHGIHRTV